MSLLDVFFIRDTIKFHTDANGLCCGFFPFLSLIFINDKRIFKYPWFGEKEADTALSSQNSAMIEESSFESRESSKRVKQEKKRESGHLPWNTSKLEILSKILAVSFLSCFSPFLPPPSQEKHTSRRWSVIKGRKGWMEKSLVGGEHDRLSVLYIPLLQVLLSIEIVFDRQQTALSSFTS